MVYTRYARVPGGYEEAVKLYPSVDTSPLGPSPIPADIAERAMALVERISNGDRGRWAIETEARAIIDALKPVDGDLIEARRAVSEMAIFNHCKDDVLSGEYDEWPIIPATIAAIAKGRSLEGGGE